MHFTGQYVKYLAKNNLALCYLSIRQVIQAAEITYLFKSGHKVLEDSASIA